MRIRIVASVDPTSHRITGDPTNAGMGDVAVGPNGIAVFYWRYLENAENNYLVDLTKPIGPQQLLKGFPSGGAAGGLHTATDGETVWAVSPAGTEGLHMPPIVYRADGKPFGTGKGRYRENVTLTHQMPFWWRWRNATTAEEHAMYTTNPLFTGMGNWFVYLKHGFRIERRQPMRIIYAILTTTVLADVAFKALLLWQSPSMPTQTVPATQLYLPVEFVEPQ